MPDSTTGIILSVHLVTASRPEMFKTCLLSVLRALPEIAEVDVVVNGPCAQTESFLNDLNSAQVRWKVVARESRCVARNRAFLDARGEFIYFLDDDVVVPDFLFKRALSFLQSDEPLCVLGGPNLTPPDSSPAESLFGAVMTSWFAAPGVRARYGGGRKAKSPVAWPHALILCNLAVRPSSFPSHFRFRELKSNEENLFLQQCLRSQMKVLFDPGLFVLHRRRSGFLSFLQQIFSYGFGRAQQTWVAPHWSALPFWIPAIVLVSALLLLGGETERVSLVYLAGLYGVLSFISAADSADVRALGLPGVLKVTGLTFFVHFSYAVGLVSGLSDCFKLWMFGNAVFSTPNSVCSEMTSPSLPRG